MRIGLPAAILLVVLAAAATGQPRYELRVSDDRAYVGEPFTVEIVIESAESVRPPVFPDIPHCTVQDVGRTSKLEIINNHVSQTVTFSYRLAPERPGELVIPPIELELDGKTFQTGQQVIQVRGADERPTIGTNQAGDALLLAEVRTSAGRLYVGQHAPFTLTIWIRIPGGVGARLSARDLYSLLRNNRTGFGPFPEPLRAERRVLDLPDGKAEFFEYKTRADVFLDRVGPVELSDLAIVMDYPMRLSREPFFGRLRIEDYETIAIRPEVHAPDVRPLPTEGRPDSFTGAVGQYEINVYTDAQSVNVGDPIPLVIEITGSGPLDTLPGPRLAQQPRLTADFRVPAETLSGKTAGRRRVFTQTVRAKRPDVSAIPPIEYAYFDPESGEYKVVRSRPIPIQVRSIETASAGELLELSAGEPADPIAALDGLYGIKTGQRELLAHAPPVTMAQAVVALVAPPAVVVGLWGGLALAQFRSSDPARRRRQRAYARAVRRIENSRGAPAEIGAALSAYLADRRNEPPGRFTGAAALELLRACNAAPETLEACTAVLDRCEAAAYGGAKSDPSLRDAALDLLRRLERERL